MQETPSGTYLVIGLQVVPRKLQHLLLLGGHVEIRESLLTNRRRHSAVAAGQSDSELFCLLFTDTIMEQSCRQAAATATSTPGRTKSAWTSRSKHLDHFLL